MIERYSRPQMKGIWSEENKFAKWLLVEIAVCEAWEELGYIPKDAITKIKKASIDLGRMAEILKVTHHDVTAFLQTISENLGEESRFIHLGMTSSDVMDTALSLQLKEASQLLKQDLGELIEVLEEKAISYKETIMIGRTHGVHAEPITFGLKMAIWIEEMRRNQLRLTEAEKNISVGKISGAVGTYATILPEVEEKTCTKLGLHPAPISNQILQRDRHAQFITTLAIIASSLEKFATEIRSMQRTELLEVEEPFTSGQTGSSAMPHKRNPELCERVCGLSRLMRGNALVAMENITLWNERNISHSSAERIILPDSCLALDYMLSIFTSVMKGLQIHTENMRRNLELTQGLIFSQRVLIAIIEKGINRQKAYELVQRNALKAWKQKTPFLTLLKADREMTDILPAKDIESLFDYNYFIQHVNTTFNRLGLKKRKTKKNTKIEELAPRAI